MDSKYVIALFNTMAEDNILYAFYGAFNFNVVDTLLVNVKQELSQFKTNNIKKKTYRILVECLENIYKHSEEELIAKKETKRSGIFILTKTKDGYKIVVGNPIQRAESRSLKQRIDELNELSLNDLKEKHRQLLKSSIISSKGGAGIGLVEIAIKSGNKLNYTFNRYKKEVDFFMLEINITK